MIKPLRKYHFIVWRLWALLLPLAFVMALVVRPTLPRTEHEFKTAITAEVEDQTDSTSMIIVKVGRAIKEPSCLAILSSPSGDVVLGTLSDEGQYTFTVSKVENEANLKLVDAIRQRNIITLPLSRKK